MGKKEDLMSQIARDSRSEPKVVVTGDRYESGKTTWEGPMTDHVREHESRDPLAHRCTECGAVFQLKEALGVHIDVTHEGKPMPEIRSIHIFEHRGHQHKYTKDENGNEMYLGPVGKAPLLTGSQFKNLMRKKERPRPEKKPCDCGAEYLKQGKIWWCPKCQENHVME